MTVRPVPPAEFADHVPALAGLLVDAVTGGASLGFVTPFDAAAAARWWHEQEPAVAAGDRLVWVCDDATGTAGTVSLALDRIPNGRHRAHVVKLMVRGTARGRGLGRALLATAERAAAAAGATLLLLDTETGSAAEHLYRSAGWTRYGVVPGYATDPAGVPRECSFYRKAVSPPRTAAAPAAAR
ncbi:GNAT family N-acetyltransferase [Pseudonocardia sp. CNS-139]|nr:GNAT family N-acetyltransferase [Pseudonocardia sp. CNS-139]